MTLVIDGQVVDLDPVKNLNMVPSVRLPSQFNQGLYHIKDQDISDNFFGKLSDLTIWTHQLTTEEMFAFMSGCESLPSKKGKLIVLNHFTNTLCYLL